MNRSAAKFLDVLDAAYILTAQEFAIFKDTFIDDNPVWLEPNATLLAQRINIATFVNSILTYTGDNDVETFTYFLKVAKKIQATWCDVADVFEKYQSNIDYIHHWESLSKHR